MNNINQIISFLQSWGINIELINNSDSNNQMFVLCFSFFTLSLIALLCVINIIIYLIILYISDNKVIVQFLSKRKITLILLNLYKNTRKVFLVSEFVLIIFCISSIIYISGIVLSAFITISISF